MSATSSTGLSTALAISHHRPNDAATRDSPACQEVLSVPELLELILLELPNKKLFAIKRTCKQFSAAIDSSIQLRRKMTIQKRPSDSSCPRIELNPLIFRHSEVHCRVYNHYRKPNTRIMSLAHPLCKIPKDSSLRELHFLTQDFPAPIFAFSDGPGQQGPLPGVNGLVLNALKVGDVIDAYEARFGEGHQHGFCSYIWVRWPRMTLDGQQ